MRIIELDELRVEEIHAQLMEYGRQLAANEDYYIGIHSFRNVLLAEFYEE